MRPSPSKRRVIDLLLGFAWDEWAQIGVFATPQRRSPWAQDPEALLVFTLEVARNDPRLFEEVLGWLLINEQLTSSRRLHAMCVDDDDARLVETVLDWLAHQRNRRREAPPPAPDDVELEPLFRETRMPADRPDPVFASHGWLRPAGRPRLVSQQPDVRHPINFAFRLRQIFGVSARAEVARCLVGIETPWVTAPVIARSAGYSKRNVQEALASLHAAGVVDMYTLNAEQRYSIEAERWAQFLDVPVRELPVHRDWPQLLAATRRLLRWLIRLEHEDLSDYMRASMTRDVLEEVREDLLYAGIRIELGPTVATAMEEFEDLIDQLSTSLGGGAAPVAEFVPEGPRQRGRFEVLQERTGTWRWRLIAPNGRAVATSAGEFDSRRAAAEAARMVRDRAEALRYEIADRGGEFRWSARAANGRLVARSADTFASRFNAERAADRARQGAVTSAGP